MSVREATSGKCCGSCRNFNLRPGMAHSGDGTCLALASRFVHEGFVCDQHEPSEDDEEDVITPPSNRRPRRSPPPATPPARSSVAPPVVDLRKFFD